MYTNVWGKGNTLCHPYVESATALSISVCNLRLLHNQNRTTVINGSRAGVDYNEVYVSSPVEALPADLSTVGSRLAVFEQLQSSF